MEKAGFLKRMFAFIVDVTIIILLTLLLYLFPFSMIINSSIDDNYKENVGNIVDEINTKYSGSSSVFGTSTDGLLTILQDYYNDGGCTSEVVQSYISNHNDLVSNRNGFLDEMVDRQSEAYNEEENVEDTYYAQVYDIYGYMLYAYNCLYSFKMDDEFNILDDSYKNAKDISSSQLSELQDNYMDELTDDFGKALNSLVIALNAYQEANQSLDLSGLTSYKNVVKQAKSTLGYATDEKILEESDVDEIKNFFERYDLFFQHFSSDALDDDKLTQQAYYAFYYDLLSLQFDELLPVHEKYSIHSTAVVIYALIAFTVLYTAYTIVLKGRTIGRRVDKIKLVNADGTENPNVIKIALHDVILGFFYLILIGCLDIRIMLIVGLAFAIVDAVMIKIPKTSKTIRNYITQTNVVCD